MIALESYKNIRIDYLMHKTYFNLVLKAIIQARLEELEIKFGRRNKSFTILNTYSFDQFSYKGIFRIMKIFF